MSRPYRLTTFFLALGGAVVAHALLLTLPLPGSPPASSTPQTLHIHLAAQAGTDHTSIRTRAPTSRHDTPTKARQSSRSSLKNLAVTTPQKAPAPRAQHRASVAAVPPPNLVIAKQVSAPAPRDAAPPDKAPKHTTAKLPEPAPPPAASLATEGSTPAPNINADTTLDPAAQRQMSDAFRARLSAYLARFRHYPLLARREGQSGIVKLHFVMNRQGQVLSRNLSQSTPFPLLNHEALALLDRAAPLPKPPAALKGRRFDYTLPITFEIH